MDDKLPPEVIVSPPEDDAKISPKDTPKASSLKVYIPLLVITLSLPIIFLSSRYQQNFFGRASSPCGNSYPCPTPCGNSYPCPTQSPRPCVNTYNCPTPTPIVKNNPPVIMTTDLRVAGIGQRYNAMILGMDNDSKETLVMTISGLPAGLAAGKCQLTSSTSYKISRIICPISGVPSKAGLYTVSATLQDRPPASDSITVSKNFSLNVLGVPIQGTGNQ